MELRAEFYPMYELGRETYLGYSFYNSGEELSKNTFSHVFTWTGIHTASQPS